MADESARFHPGLVATAVEAAHEDLAAVQRHGSRGFTGDHLSIEIERDHIPVSGGGDVVPVERAERIVAVNFGPAVPSGRIPQHRVQAGAVEARSAEGRVGLEDEGVALASWIVSRGGNQREILQPCELREQADGEVPLKQGLRFAGDQEILRLVPVRQVTRVVPAVLRR